MTYTIEACGKLSELLPQPLKIQSDAHTVNELIADISRQFPAVGPEMPRTAIARGAAILDRDAQLADGDALALIPPVGGG